MGVEAKSKHETQTESWEGFKKRCERLAKRDPTERQAFWFRGQADSSWELKPSVDRLQSFDTSERRQDSIESLLRRFWNQAQGLHSFSILDPTSDSAAMLARHHGLPTNLLDWTTSPYVAAYFAFDGGIEMSGASPCVWVFNRFALLASDSPEVSLIDELGFDAPNVRSIEQRSVYMRLESNAGSIDGLLPGQSLVKLVFPREDVRTALIDLDEMGINARSLFRSLEGVARMLTTKKVLEGKIR